MTEEITKFKPDPSKLFHKLGLAKLQEAAIEAEKEEYMDDLADVIRDAYSEWQNALANFDTAESKEMIDYYSYRIKASEIRYGYYLRKAKEAKAQ
ncbi:MAG: DUF2508 family protein [Acetivibrionales bacterium]|jgi:hypothetical protein|nr:DUF2508 family protein [Clostridiaceae bacterium]